MSKNGKSAPSQAVQPQVFWAVLLERSVNGRAVNSLLNVAAVGGLYGFTRLVQPYMRTDLARNNLIAKFLADSKSPDDVLVMLDNDHEFSDPYIVAKLAASPHGVTGALAFRRGSPFDPCVFVRCPDNKLHPIATWNKGDMIECQMVGHGAIAIKRRVYDDLLAFGFKSPYYRYEYPDDGRAPSEDMYFGRVCEAAGINHYCDTSLVIPHLTDDVIDDQTWAMWLKMNPDQVQPQADVTGVKDWKISVIIPTRGRADQVRRCINQLYATCSPQSVECVIVSEDTLIEDDRITMIVCEDGLPPVEKWNRGAEQATGEAIMMGADDLWFASGWYAAACAALDKLPNQSGLVGVNGLEPIERDFSTHYIATRSYIYSFTDGCLVAPYYWQYFVDLEGCYKAQHLGRYLYAQDCVVEHRHVLWGKAQEDETYQRSAPHYAEDESIFKHRQALGFEREVIAA